MKKIFIILLLLLMMITACTKDSNVNPVEETTEQPEETLENETEEPEEPIKEETEETVSEEPLTEEQDKPTENEQPEELEESKENEITEEVRIDTGKFSGMIDANFFEVQISGVPENIAARVFMLTDESREIFNELKLEADDEIKIHYYVNDQEQMVVVNIEKMN